MIITGFLLLLGTLIALANASSFRNTQEISLGGTFLAIATNYTPSGTTYATTTETKSGYFTSELDVSAIGPLAAKLDLLCAQQGHVESKSQSGNETATTSYNLGCRVPMNKFAVFQDAVIALLNDAAQDKTATYTYSWDSYMSSYSASSDPAMHLAQQQALESLLAEADTIQDVMLVVTAWQSVVSQYSTSSSFNRPSSSFTITLTQKYVYDVYTSSPIVSPPVSAPTAKP